MDFDAILSENTNGSAVQVRERHAADAANEEGHAAPNGPLSGIDPAEVGEREVAVDPWGERIQLGDPKSLQQSAPACQALQSRALIEAHQPRLRARLLNDGSTLP